MRKLIFLLMCISQVAIAQNYVSSSTTESPSDVILFGYYLTPDGRYAYTQSHYYDYVRCNMADVVNKTAVCSFVEKYNCVPLGDARYFAGSSGMITDRETNIMKRLEGLNEPVGVSADKKMLVTIEKKPFTSSDYEGKSTTGKIIVWDLEKIKSDLTKEKQAQEYGPSYQYTSFQIPNSYATENVRFNPVTGDLCCYENSGSTFYETNVYIKDTLQTHGTYKIINAVLSPNSSLGVFLCISKNGDSECQKFILYDFSKDEQVAVLDSIMIKPNSWLKTPMEISYTGKYLAYTIGEYGEESVNIINLEQLKPEVSFKSNGPFHFSQTENYFFISTDEGILFYNTHNWERIMNIDFTGIYDGIMSSDDNNFFAFTTSKSNRRSVFVDFDLEKMRQQLLNGVIADRFSNKYLSLEGYAELSSTYGTTCFQVSKDGNYAILMNDHMIKVYDMKTGFLLNKSTDFNTYAELLDDSKSIRYKDKIYALPGLTAISESNDAGKINYYESFDGLGYQFNWSSSLLITSEGKKESVYSGKEEAACIRFSQALNCFVGSFSPYESGQVQVNKITTDPSVEAGAKIAKFSPKYAKTVDPYFDLDVTGEYAFFKNINTVVNLKTGVVKELTPAEVQSNHQEAKTLCKKASDDITESTGLLAFSDDTLFVYDKQTLKLTHARVLNDVNLKMYGSPAYYFIKNNKLIYMMSTFNSLVSVADANTGELQVQLIDPSAYMEMLADQRKNDSLYSAMLSQYNEAHQYDPVVSTAKPIAMRKIKKEQNRIVMNQVYQEATKSPVYTSCSSCGGTGRYSEYSRTQTRETSGSWGYSSNYELVTTYKTTVTKCSTCDGTGRVVCYNPACYSNIYIPTTDAVRSQMENK